MAQEFKEKTITVNLRKANFKPDTKKATSAQTQLIKAATKETRLKEYKVSNKVNETLWARGKFKTPRKITIKIINDKGTGRILLPEEKYEEKKKEDKNKQKEETTKTGEKKKTETRKQEEQTTGTEIKKEEQKKDKKETKTKEKPPEKNKPEEKKQN